MAVKSPATVGEPLSVVDTPALIIDLDAYERNFRTMSDLARGYRRPTQTQCEDSREPDNRQVSDRTRCSRDLLPEGL